VVVVVVFVIVVVSDMTLETSMSKVMLSYVFKTNLAHFRAAVMDEDTDKICRMLDVDRDYLNKCIDTSGNTALLLAVEYTSPLTVRLLLEQGAQPDQINELTLRTPLGSVVDHCNPLKSQRAVAMSKLLLEYGAFVDKPSLRNCVGSNKQFYLCKETPLMTAARKGHVSLVKLLLDNKANANYVERQTQMRP
jgi:ankyrin repeat protein